MQTPYFLFKPRILEKNYREFESLCTRYLGNYLIAYSVKTNSFNGVIDKLNDLRSNFEIASLNEIEKTPRKAKIFNGCCKTEEELGLAVDGKFLINIDSKTDIDKLVKILKGKAFNIGLRVSLAESKFGIEENRLEKAINYCKKNNLNVVSLHFHSGTQKTLKFFEENLRKAEKIVFDVLSQGVKLRYVDVGGGFPDKFQMKNLNCSLEDYFVLIEKYFKKFNLKIILEPGRILVSDAFDLYSKVCVIKQNFGKNYAILDVGINVLSKITLSGYRFSKFEVRESNMPSNGKIENISNLARNKSINNKLTNRSSQNLEDFKNKNKKKEYILAGPLLFNNDILGKYVGNLGEGDLIRVENVGAYCYNLAWEISYKKPKVFIE